MTGARLPDSPDKAEVVTRTPVGEAEKSCQSERVGSAVCHDATQAASTSSAHHDIEDYCADRVASVGSSGADPWAWARLRDRRHRVR